MKKGIIFIVGFNFCLMLVLSSCVKPKLSNTHKANYTYSVLPDTIPAPVEVYVSQQEFQATAKKKEPLFIEMRDSIPHAFMKYVAMKTDTSLSDFIKALRTPIEEPSKNTVLKIDPEVTSFKKKFLLTSIKNYDEHELYVHPNTRLVSLTTKISLPNNKKIKIQGIDQIINEFDTLSFGAISRSTSTTASGSVTAGSDFSDTSELIDTMENILTENSKTETISKSRTLSGALKGEMSLSNQTAINETLDKRSRHLKTGYAFDDFELIVTQRSLPLEDISDMTYITARFQNIETDNRKVLFFGNSIDKKNGSLLPVNDIKFQISKVKFLNCENPGEQEIPMSICYSGLVRTVKNSRFTSQSILEFDDRVTYYYFEKIKNEVLKVPCDQYYSVSISTKVNDKETEYDLKYRDPNVGEVQVLKLNSNDVGNNEFDYWLTKLLEDYSDRSDFRTTQKFELYLVNTKSGTPKIVLIGSKPTDLTGITFKYNGKKVAPNLTKNNFLKLNYKDKGFGGISSIENDSEGKLVLIPDKHKIGTCDRYVYNTSDSSIVCDSGSGIIMSDIESFRFTPDNSAYYFTVEKDNGESSLYKKLEEDTTLVYTFKSKDDYKRNMGAESLSFDSDGNLWVAFEATRSDGKVSFYKFNKNDLSKEKVGDPEKYSYSSTKVNCSTCSGYAVSEIQFLNDDNLAVLERRKIGDEYWTNIVKCKIDGNSKEVDRDGFFENDLVSPYNFEGMSLHSNSEGKKYLYIVSDNDFEESKPTVLYTLEVIPQIKRSRIDLRKDITSSTAY